MFGSRRFNQAQTEAELARVVNGEWLDAAPAPGAPELKDTEIPIPMEPISVTMQRIEENEANRELLDRASAYDQPDGVFEGLDADLVTELAKTDLTDTTIGPSSDTRRFLEAGGEAAHLLLETLDRGLDATTPELEAATTERLVAAYGRKGAFPNQPGPFENTSTHNGFSL